MTDQNPSGETRDDLKLLIAHTIIEDLRVQHPGLEQIDNERGDLWLPGGSTPQSSGCVVDIHSIAAAIADEVESEVVKAAYQRGWNDRESDILERAERILPASPPSRALSLDEREWISREDHEAALTEAQTLDKGFYEWMIERDLLARGEEVDWADIVVALTEHEIELSPQILRNDAREAWDRVALDMADMSDSDAGLLSISRIPGRRMSAFAGDLRTLLSILQPEGEANG